MRTAVLHFVQMIPTLDHDEEQLIKQAFAGVGDRQKVRELVEASQEQNRCGPHCQSTQVYRHGKSDGLQRYRCVKCGKTYRSDRSCAFFMSSWKTVAILIMLQPVRICKLDYCSPRGLAKYCIS